MLIGVLIPQFPGQTHIFVWRELSSLRSLGVTCHTVTTRGPTENKAAHAWANQAASETPVLFPISRIDLLATALVFNPPAISNLFRAWWGLARSRDMEWRVLLRSLGLTVLGAKLKRLAHSRGWQHIHVHSCADAALIAMFCRAMGGPTYSMTLHSPISMYGPAQPLKWRNAAFGIAVTPILKAEILTTVPGLPADSVGVAAMGVDLNVFRRTKPYSPPAEREPWNLVTCGRLHTAKGHQDVIAAIALLRGRGREVTLRIAGGGSARPHLEQQIERLGLKESITLLGSVSETTVRDELERSHMFCLGSHDEAIGVATMEAMAMELPVVVTRVGGVPLLVTDGLHGRLVPAHAPPAIADAIEAILQTPAEAVRMGRAGCDKVNAEFGADRSALLLKSMIEANTRRVSPTHASPN